MHNLFLTTAAIALIGGAAVAQQTTGTAQDTTTGTATTTATGTGTAQMPDFANMIPASHIIGGNIYSLATAGMDGTATVGTGTATTTTGTTTTGTAGTGTADTTVGTTPGTAPAPGLTEPGAAPGTAGVTDGWGTGTTFDTVDPNWDNIGSIDDVILDREGQMVGVTGDIGGWLGIGTRQVFLPIQDVQLVPAGDTDYAYVTRYSREQLEQLPDISDGWAN